MGNLKELMKDIVKVIVFSILFVSIPITLGIIGGTIEASQSEKEYNNGICSKCGGNYKFVSLLTLGIAVMNIITRVKIADIQ